MHRINIKSNVKYIILNQNQSTQILNQLLQNCVEYIYSHSVTLSFILIIFCPFFLSPQPFTHSGHNFSSSSFLYPTLTLPPLPFSFIPFLSLTPSFISPLHLLCTSHSFSPPCSFSLSDTFNMQSFCLIFSVS